jgi:hybrid cluster-associated redox disulfide protein
MPVSHQSNNTSQEQTINKNMLMSDIFEKFPEQRYLIAEEMMKTGLHCIGCHAAAWETLQEGALSHGLSSNEIDSLIDRLNAIIEE